MSSGGAVTLAPRTGVCGFVVRVRGAAVVHELLVLSSIWMRCHERTLRQETGDDEHL
jgi:hypothetical protein